MALPAIEGLYRKHGAMVLRRARAILGDEQRAKDVLQEVFVRAIQAGDSFRGQASPVTWLYQVTTNLCLNRIRDELRRAELDGRQEAQSGAAPASAEDRATVAELLRRVPEELRAIGVCYYVDGMDQEEIATLLGVSRRTVGNRLEAFREVARAAAGLEATP
ncbi:MAG: RNA polymerase sigma factor [Myxococcales bacterium]